MSKMITFKHKGSFRKTDRFLNKVKNLEFMSHMREYGERGVQALAAATPVNSGATASSWTYDIVRSDRGVSIYWINNNVNKGVNIAVIIQFGHGTGTGGWVEGRDYINPSIRPVFDEIAESAWKEVTG